MGFLFSPLGRVSLGRFWLWFLLPMMAVQIVAAIGDTLFFQTSANLQTGLPQPGPFVVLVGLFYFWPSIAVPIKRFHDHGMTGWWVVGGAVIMAITIVSGLFALAPKALGLGGGSPLAFIVFIPGVLASLWLYGLVYVWPGQSGGNSYGPGPAHTDDIAAFEEEIMAQTRVETGTPVYRSPDGPTRFNREQPARVGPRVSFGHKSR